MGSLSPPRSPEVSAALGITRELGGREIIDGAPALRHAVRVVVSLERYVPEPEPQLAAGIILHDTPYFVPDREVLDARIRDEVGPTAADIVTSIWQEHRYMGQAEGMSDDLQTHLTALADMPDLTLLYATAADKITSFESITGRAAKADDVVAFWIARRALAVRLPYFRAFHEIAGPKLPDQMAEDYDNLVATIERDVAVAYETAGEAL